MTTLHLTHSAASELICLLRKAHIEALAEKRWQDGIHLGELLSQTAVIQSEIRKLAESVSTDDSVVNN